MPAFTIRPISAAETRQLRHRVLRPHQLPESLVYPGDNVPDALHVGAFAGETLVGIASVAPQPFPGEHRPGAWQLEGVATVAEVRRQGVGVALIKACLAHIAAHDGRLIWCNGRISALAFYGALGFQPYGEEFVTATGPHYVLWRAVGEG